MPLSLLLALLLLLPPAPCQTGTLSQYALRPTLEVIRNRSVPGRTAYTLPADWRKYDGLLAVKDCADLGKVYRVTWRGHTGRFLAFDCSGSQATAHWMVRHGIVGEVDYWTALDWGMIGKGLRGAMVCPDTGTIAVRRGAR